MILFPFTAFFHLQNPSLTVEEAIRIAEQNAYSLRIAQSSVERSRLQYQQAEGSRKPQVRFEASYTRFDKEISGSSGTIRPIDSKSASLGLAYPIDLTGSLRAVAKAAEYILLSNQDNFQAELNSVRLSVRNSCFQVLLAQEQAAISQSALETATARLKNLELQFKQGQVAKIDVLRARTLVSQSQSDVLRDQHAIELATAALNNLLGRPIATPVSVQAPTESDRGDLSESKLLEAALSNRPELKALRKQGSSFSELARAAKAAQLPTLNLSVQHSWNFGELGFSSTEQSTVGVLSVSFPIYDAGISRSKVRQNEEDLKQAILRYEQAALGIELEVRQALTSFRNAESQLIVAADQVASAEENQRLQLLRAANGEGIELEVIDSQNQLTLARASLAAARYRRKAAFAQLQKAVGDDGLEAINQGGKK